MSAPTQSRTAPRLHLVFSDGRPKGQPLRADSDASYRVLNQLLHRALVGELGGFAIALVSASGAPEFLVAGSLKRDTALAHLLACKLSDGLRYEDIES